MAQCERVVWAISPGGSSSPREMALSAVLDAIVGFPLFRFLYHCPSIGQIQDKVSTWVVSHRQFFPGIRPYCLGFVNEGCRQTGKLF